MSKKYVIYVTKIMSPNLLIINIGSANIDLSNDTNYILIQKTYQVYILEHTAHVFLNILLT